MEVPFLAAECKVKTIIYLEGLVTINLDTEDDESWQINIKTDTFFIARGFYTFLNSFDTNVVLYDLKEHLSLENGLFAPAKTIPELSNDLKRGLTLAYGQRVSGCEMVLNMSSGTRIFSCLIYKPQDIQFTKLD